LAAGLGITALQDFCGREKKANSLLKVRF